jgi:hypothetical protein
MLAADESLALAWLGVEERKMENCAKCGTPLKSEAARVKIVVA